MKKISKKTINALKQSAPRIAALSVLAAGIIVVVIVFFNRSLGWFASNDSVNAEDMEITANSGLFDIELVGADEVFPYQVTDDITVFASDVDNGGYKKMTTTTAADQSILVKIVNEQPIEAGVNDLAPGTHGKIGFYIKPHTTNNLTFTFTLTPTGIAYNSTTSEYEYTSSLSTLNLLKGHILFFENRHYADVGETYYHYTDRIDGTFTYTTFGKTPDAQGRYYVEFYWAWPITFSQMVFTEDNSKLRSHSLFDSADINDMVSYIGSHRSYFFKFTDTVSAADYATMMSDYGNAYYVDLTEGYNNADQEIGESVQYYALLLNIAVS